MIERDMVLNLYKMNISTAKSKVVLYGTGRYTKDIIESFPEDSIVGVCDEKYHGATFCGKRVIPITEVQLYSDRLILIARPLFHHDIFLRLGKLGLSQDVKVINIGGIPVDNRELTWESFEKSIKEKVKTDGDRLLYDYIIQNIKSGNTDITCIMVPYLISFLSWLRQKSASFPENSMIWFVARDGYYISNLFNRFAKDKETSVDNLYVYGSRRAFSVMHIHNENDILDVIKYKLTNGTIGDVLKNRFGIECDASDGTVNLSDRATPENIMLFKDRILERAEFERNNYLKYLKANGLLRKTVFFFDLVTSGTSVYFIKKLFAKECIDSKVELLCYAYINAEREYDGDLSCAWYGEQSYYSTERALPNVYPPLEVLFSPRNGMLEFIDEEGRPQFAEMTDEERIQWDRTVLPFQQKCEREIEKFVSANSNAFLLEYSLDFADAILEPLWPENAEMIKKGDKLVLSNPYDSNSKVSVVL